MIVNKWKHEPKQPQHAVAFLRSGTIAALIEMTPITERMIKFVNATLIHVNHYSAIFLMPLAPGL